MARPIKIVRVTHGYNMFVNDVPVIPDGKNGVTIDRAKAGLGHNKTPIPDGIRPRLFKKKEDVKSIAHQVGRYLLNLGDFVSTYVDLVGFPAAEAARFWNG
jgi:hypothetical protein